MITSDKLEQFINVDGNQIDGWFFPADMITFWLIDSIQNTIGLSGSLCEVGVFEGKSLALLSKFGNGEERVYGIDLFPGDMRARALNNVTKFGDVARTKLIAIDTAEITLNLLKSEFADGIRILHIDAGHEYHEVLHQLMIFAPFVKRGGCIVMDDYQDREFPGIEAAVLDFCEIDRPRRFVPFFAGGNKMYLCERHLAQTYQKCLLQYEPVKDKSRITRVRDFNLLVGFSKLPVAAEDCVRNIDEYEYPMVYDIDTNGLSNNASKFSQLSFGSGKMEI